MVALLLRARLLGDGAVGVGERRVADGEFVQGDCRDGKSDAKSDIPSVRFEAVRQADRDEEYAKIKQSMKTRTRAPVHG